jgi:Heavy metal associated domain 2
MLDTRKNEGAVLGPAVVFRQDGAMLCASVVHHVPGRMRLRSSALKGDVLAIAALRCRLADIAGVTAVTTNACTGSVLLEYEPAVVVPDALAEALAARGVETDTAEDRWADELTSAVKGWVANLLAEQLAFSLIRLLA